MALPASDNYTRADANPIGGNWTTATGVNGHKILSNQCRIITANADACSYWNADTPNNDQWAQITYGGTTFGDGPAVRISTSATDYYFITDSGGNIFFYRSKTGVQTQLGTALNAVSAWAVGDTLKLEVIGSTLKAYRNGVQIGSTYTDATPLTTGRVGVYMYSDTTYTAWAGGNVGAISGDSANACWLTF